ncbi:hypothetical protein Bxe_C0496 [Paraburkholderia xenovorans LB400]|uniref:Uncharacterized protein n=1 Tax=Paraburkholderia xenovorans (strain LB400) TaxID=266265 RepID=Q13HP2_PARXL|nr:hypothetical protein Bxe_C0496 [Paraburkholderia xenovorans LB400]
MAVISAAEHEIPPVKKHSSKWRRIMTQRRCGERLKRSSATDVGPTTAHVAAPLERIGRLFWNQPASHKSPDFYNSSLKKSDFSKIKK